MLQPKVDGFTVFMVFLQPYLGWAIFGLLPDEWGDRAKNPRSLKSVTHIPYCLNLAQL